MVKTRRAACVDTPEESDMSIALMDPMMVLPPEIILNVCAYLNPLDLIHLGQVSSAWRNVARSDAAWRNICIDPMKDEELAFHVVHVAPYLRSVRLVGDADGPFAYTLMDSSIKVGGLDLSHYMDPQEDMIKYFVVKFSDSLEALELGVASHRLLSFIYTIHLPKLKDLKVRDLLENEEDIPEEESLEHKNVPESTLEAIGFYDNLQGPPDAIVAFLKAHKNTLREVEFPFVDVEFPLNKEEEVVEALAACSRLQRASLECEVFALLVRREDGGGVQALQSLSLWMYQHTTQHKTCLERLPDTLQHLEVNVEDDTDGPFVLRTLLRLAPRLRALRSLVLACNVRQDAIEAATHLPPALPGVKVSIVCSQPVGQHHMDLELDVHSDEDDEDDEDNEDDEDEEDDQDQNQEL